MQNRTTPFRRYRRVVAIGRKKRIIRDSWHGGWHYKHEGELSKGKVHCSCPMCRRKSYDMARQDDICRALSALDALTEYRLSNSKAAHSIRNRVRFKRSLQTWRPPACIVGGLP